MKCWKCENEAMGICRFCGRGVCKEHMKTKVYIVSTHSDAEKALNCLAVDGALFCGKCKPIAKPVKVEGIS